MSDERLILITDSTGASLKRWSVSLRTLRRMALVAILLGIAALGCLVHSVLLHPKASETTALKRENTRLMNALEQRRNERAGLLNADWKLSAIKRVGSGESLVSVAQSRSIPRSRSWSAQKTPWSQKQSLDPWSRSTATTSSMSDRLLRP